ncbi:unnamed protein product, partial [Nesidiocoris tenuis]
METPLSYNSTKWALCKVMYMKTEEARLLGWVGIDSSPSQPPSTFGSSQRFPIYLPATADRSSSSQVQISRTIFVFSAMKTINQPMGSPFRRPLPIRTIRLNRPNRSAWEIRNNLIYENDNILSVETKAARQWVAAYTTTEPVVPTLSFEGGRVRPRQLRLSGEHFHIYRINRNIEIRFGGSKRTS